MALMFYFERPCVVCVCVFVHLALQQVVLLSE